MIELPRPLAIGLAMSAVLVLAACSSAVDVPATASPGEAAFLEENGKAMSAMMSGMEVTPTGDVDRDFALMMIPHHQGAIDMAQALLKYGKNEELKALARNIVEKQADEIALMKRIAGERPAGTNLGGGMKMPHGDHM